MPSSLHLLDMPLFLRFPHEKHSGGGEAVLPARNGAGDDQAPA